MSIMGVGMRFLSNKLRTFIEADAAEDMVTQAFDS